MAEVLGYLEVKVCSNSSNIDHSRDAQLLFWMGVIVTF